MVPTKEELEKEAIPLREKTLAEVEEAVYKQVLDAQVRKLSTVDVVSRDLPVWAVKEVASKYRDLGYRVSECSGIFQYAFTIVLDEKQLRKEWKEAEEGYYKIPDKKWWQFWK